MIFNVGAGNGGNVVYLTQAEYDALPDSKLNNNVEYRIIDGNADEGKASNLSYDNSASGLEANNVQTAIDKVNESLVASDNLKFRFATDGEGNYGYLGADDSFIPFKSDLVIESFTNKNYSHRNADRVTSTVNALNNISCQIGNIVCVFAYITEWSNILELVDYSGVSIISEKINIATVNLVECINMMCYLLEITDNSYSFNLKYGATNSGTDRNKGLMITNISFK